MDLAGLCIVAFFILILFMVFSIFLRPRMAGAGPRQRVEPYYDDPDINSRGTFGRPSTGHDAGYDDPEVRSQGSFGRPTPSSRKNPSGGLGGVLGRGGGSRGASRSGDDNIRSRGSFGGKRD